MLIELTDITKTYGVGGGTTDALRGVNLHVSEGEFIAVMGPSGSGKSTLLHILSLLDRPTQGLYRFKERNVRGLSDDAFAKLRNESFGFVFQTFNLLPRATVLENIMLPLVYADVPAKERISRARAAMARVGLTQRSRHRSNELSGGEKQRVAIARAVVNRPEVIFADEPTGNLDSSSGEQVMQTLEDLHTEGRTIILVTHETYTAGFAQRIIRLKDGRIVEDKRIDRPHSTKDHHFTK